MYLMKNWSLITDALQPSLMVFIDHPFTDLGTHL